MEEQEAGEVQCRGMVEEQSAVDRVLLRVGLCGLYQKLQLLMLWTLPILSACFAIEYVFIAYVNPHTCTLPPTPAPPPDTAGASGAASDAEGPARKHPDFYKCNLHIYDEDYNVSLVPGQFLPRQRGNDSDHRQAQCAYWQYDTSRFTATITTQWNLVCDAELLRPISQMLFFLGFLLGSIIMGDLSDRLGRFKSLLISIAIQGVFGLLTAFSTYIGLFMFFRFLTGFGLGGQLIVSFTLSMEIVDPGRRTVVGMMLNYVWVVGELLLAALGYGIRNWVHLQITLGCIALVPLVYFWYHTLHHNQLLDDLHSNDIITHDIM